MLIKLILVKFKLLVNISLKLILLKKQTIYRYFLINMSNLIKFDYIKILGLSLGPIDIKNGLNRIDWLQQQS